MRRPHVSVLFITLVSVWRVRVSVCFLATFISRTPNHSRDLKQIEGPWSLVSVVRDLERYG